jgi:hypothetical protein
MEYHAARAEGLGETMQSVKTLAQIDPRGAGILMDKVYWRDLHPEKARAEKVATQRLVLGRKKDELELEKLAYEVKLVALRADVAAKLAEKSGKQDEGLVFGLTNIITDESISVASRQEVAHWAVRMGLVLIERADLSKAPPAARRDEEEKHATQLPRP